MAFFKGRTVSGTTGDPFLDHVVEITTADGNNFVSIKALRNSDVFTAIKILASDIASSPLQVVKDGLPKEENELVSLFNGKPNDLMDGWHFKFCLAVNMLLNGNSFAEIIRGDDNKPIGLDIIANSEMNVKQLDNGSLRYEVGAQSKSKRKLKASDVLHFKYFTQDGLVGIPPLYALKDELKIQEAGNKTIFNYFKRGINSSGILTVKKSDLDSKAKKAIREKFEEANGSDSGDNAVRTIVLDDTMDYKKLEVDTSVLKLINSNDWNTKQISKCFGIPSDRLEVENAHSSVAQSNLIYLQNTLSHYFACFVSEIKNKLLDNDKLGIRFNTERFMETDPLTMAETTLKQVQGSLLTINEGRAKLGYSPVDGGDRLMASLNYTYLDMLERYQLQQQEGAIQTDGE